jgi:hypothetical protein
MTTGAIDLTQSMPDYTEHLRYSTSLPSAETFTDGKDGGTGGLHPGSPYLFEVCQEDDNSLLLQPPDSQGNCAEASLVAPPPPPLPPNNLAVCLAIPEGIPVSPAGSGAIQAPTVQPVNPAQPTTTTVQLVNPPSQQGGVAPRVGAARVAAAATPCSGAVAAGQPANVLLTWDWEPAFSDSAPYPWSYIVERQDAGKWAPLGAVGPNGPQETDQWFELLLQNPLTGQLTATWATGFAGAAVPLVSFLDNQRPVPADYPHWGGALTYRVCASAQNPPVLYGSAPGGLSYADPWVYFDHCSAPVGYATGGLKPVAATVVAPGSVAGAGAVGVQPAPVVR